MATYATQADYLATVEGAAVVDAAALERILERAERDVDRVLGPIRRREDTGLKLDPATDLRPFEREALARAVALQAEHRMTSRGEGSGGLERQAKKISGPDFTVEYADAGAPAGADQRLGAGVAEELDTLARFRPVGARAR